MVKTSLISTATALSIAVAKISSTSTVVEAFSSSTSCQPSLSSTPRINALSTSVVTKSKCARPPSSLQINSRIVTTRLNNVNSSSSAQEVNGDKNHNNHRSSSSLFPIKATSQQLTTTLITLIQRLRKSFAILVASLTILLGTAVPLSSQHFVPHAHAAAAASYSSAIVAKTSSPTTTTTSWTQKLLKNPFKTKSANEMIDEYVRDRLFADDAYDPVESAYREVYADYSSGGSGSEVVGAYPTLLAETASSALGRKQDVSSIVSSPSRGIGGSMAKGVGTAGEQSGKNDGITAVLIRTSDFLQRRLRVSASVSYYIIAASGILSLCVLPGTIGVLYQGIQRLQIDKSEMKMYGKIADMDATSKRESPDDDDDDDDDDEE